MNIAIICDHVPSTWAHSMNAMKHAQGFFKLGHKVEVLILRRIMENNIHNFKTNTIHDIYAINKKIKLRYFSDYYPYHFKKVRYLRPFLTKLGNIRLNYSSKLLSLLDVEKKISDFCKKNNVNYAYCRRTERTAVYNILNKIPTVIETHNIKNITFPNLDMHLLLNLSNNEYFKGIVTVHEILKKKFMEQGVPEEKILVLEDAVDLDPFKEINGDKIKLRHELGLPKDKKIIMYCGSLKSGKGIGNILETAKRLNDGALCCVVGGTIKDNKCWQKKARKKKVKNIIFLGFKNGISIPRYLKSADILLMPYDLNEKNPIMNYNITSPLKLFEYMASKNPIISTKIPTIEKIVQHGKEALLAESGNINEIIEFIEILLDDNHLMKELTNNAYNKVKNYTCVKRCEKILKKLQC